ncbi:MAG TPA: PEP-CTERM sorting domain-containing protein [Bryobacteraceae bacterium]|nr:PEP-CTERM sorting domain-containing protein [Bryobacteraceae bacterium]
MNLMPSLAKLSVAMLLVAAPVWSASIEVTLDSSLQSAEPGDVVTFTGTIENTGVDTVYLNGFSSTFPLGGVDDSAFFLLPASLAPFGTASGPLFSVMIPGGAALGLYAGTFNVLGGDTPTSFDLLATQTFAVNVVPEPSSALLALGGVFALILRRRTRS